jgi:hypothetical protein
VIMIVLMITISFWWYTSPEWWSLDKICCHLLVSGQYGLTCVSKPGWNYRKNKLRKSYYSVQKVILHLLSKILKIHALPLVLCWCEVSLTAGEWHKLHLFGNKVYRKMYWLKRDEISAVIGYYTTKDFLVSTSVVCKCSFSVVVLLL